ncbi:MAG: galactose mutarotase [Cyanobacteria bacterium M_surface_10_m2_179]|nr:galactose mutarotase [Cyanobacteria bacterium M_surface_10_m2_179]
MTLTRLDAPFPHWQFTAASGDQLRVVPERGGLLTGWRCGGQELLYFDAQRFADPAMSVRGGIPVLFPVCGNLPGKQLQLPQGSFPMAQHGFARDLPWQLQALEDGEGIRLTLGDSPATLSAYPFRFRLNLDYRLEHHALAIRAVVEHLEAVAEPAPMPFALGLHPYLQVENLAQARVEGLPQRCWDHLSATEVATADQLARLEQGVDLRVACPAGEAVAPRVCSGSGAALELQMEPPFAHAVLWSDPPRPMLCLEPWSAPRGELGLQLQPGERCELRCRYAFTPA